MKNEEKDKAPVISSERENQYPRWVNPVHFFTDTLEQDISLTFDMIKSLVIPIAISRDPPYSSRESQASGDILE